MSTVQERPFPKELERKYRDWGRCSTAWYVLHFGLGIAGIALPPLIPFCEAKITQGLLGTAAAASTALVTFLGARRNATLYVQAWRALNLARLDYMYGQIDITTVLELIKCRERIIEATEIEREPIKAVDTQAEIKQGKHDNAPAR